MTHRDCHLVEIVVPAHNEAAILDANIERLLDAASGFGFSWAITIVDSASTDDTWQIARRLEERRTAVSALRAPHPGRGRALRMAWERSDATVLAYIDADLSGGAESLGWMADRILEGEADLVIGSRLVDGALVERRAIREFLSRTYSEVLQWVAMPPFLDAQCGLKVLRADVVRPLLAQVHDQAWFFDTELLLAAWQSGARIHEVPLHWVERPQSTVRLPSTIADDLKGLARITRTLRTNTRPALTRPMSPSTPHLHRLAAAATATAVGAGLARGVRPRTVAGATALAQLLAWRAGEHLRRSWSATR